MHAGEYEHKASRKLLEFITPLTVQEASCSLAASHPSLKGSEMEVKMDGGKLAAKSALPAGEIIRAPAPLLTSTFSVSSARPMLTASNTSSEAGSKSQIRQQTESE